MQNQNRLLIGQYFLKSQQVKFSKSGYFQYPSSASGRRSEGALQTLTSPIFPMSMIWSQRKYSLYQNFWYEAIILTDYLFFFFFTFEKYYDSDSILFIVLEKIQDDFL